jgi:hypothetical protein
VIILCRLQAELQVALKDVKAAEKESLRAQQEAKTTRYGGTLHYCSCPTPSTLPVLLEIKHQCVLFKKISIKMRVWEHKPAAPLAARQFHVYFCVNFLLKT